MTEQRNSPDFSRARVLVVGDVMLDRNWSGSVARISPEAPVPVVKIGRQNETPGGAANVAMNLAALGAQAVLCGLVGEDAQAAALRGFLKDHGIEEALVSCPMATITKLRVLSRQQQLIRLDFEGEESAVFAHRLLPVFRRQLLHCDVVVFSDYGKGALKDITVLISMAKDSGKTVLVDPKGRDFFRYRGADILTPNRGELVTVTEDFTDEDLPVTARKFLADSGVAALLVTLSERGMHYVDAEDDYYLPAQTREVYDVTGAGDTVIATLAAALAAGYRLKTAVSFANAAAGVVVGKPGTATLSAAELRAALAPQRARTHGVVDEATLLAYVENARLRGQRIVMTNGCFDILHVGHITYLEEAKALGDRLIVAVNSDESVRRLKGADRPANTLQSRARVLAALESVDWVVPFADDTPVDLIAAVAPDVLVKGGDNRVEDIPGAAEVLAGGGEVKILSYVEGFSTSKTLQKYKK